MKHSYQKPTLKVIQVSKLNLKRFSHTVHEMKTFSGFIVENHDSFSGRNLEKTPK